MNPPNPSSSVGETPRQSVTARALLLGFFFAGLFAYITVVREHTPPSSIMTATQIAVLPFVLLVISVLLVNPLLRRVVPFVRQFSRAELMTVFVMGAVSSGISTFGLASQLVPMTSSLMNPAWNNDQSRWDIYVEPYVNEKFFVAESGTRKAAVQHRNAYVALHEAQDALRAARAYRSAEQLREEAKRDLAEAEAIADEMKRELKVNAARNKLRFADRAVAQAADLWAPYGEKHTIDQVLDEFPDKIVALQKKYAEAKKDLDELEEQAQQDIQTFRRGLPDEMRAIPGFIHVENESMAAYKARVKRLLQGVRALKELRKARRAVEPSSDQGVADAKKHIDRTIEKLEPITTAPRLEKQLEQFRAQQSELNQEIHETRQRLRALKRQRRVSPAEFFNALDQQIKQVDKVQKDLEEERTEVSDLLTKEVEPQIDVLERVRETKLMLEEIGEDLQTAGPDVELAALADRIDQIAERFRTFDASFERFAIGDIDWSLWIRPIFLWCSLVLITYLVLMTFNVLIFRQWAYNERLIYPLAELPMLLAGKEDDDAQGGQQIPIVFRSTLFWVGLCISCFVIGWNLLQKYHGMPIGMTFELTDYVKGTALEGISPGAKLHVFFTLIGLSFLVPARISHSLWFFHLGYMFLLLVLVWMGFGVNENSFPKDWHYVLNFRTAIGGGALMVFSSVVLWKCRSYLLCAIRPIALEGLPDEERRELRISSWLFVGGSIALIAMLTFGLGANLFYSILFYAIILIMTIGLVRAVTEGGILGFQCHFGPFHFIRSVFGMNHKWSSPALFAPLVIFYSIMFLDIKTFIAPAMANSLKIRDDAGMERFRFHFAIAVGILIAMAVAIVTHIVIGYHQGADAMHGWFYGGFPKGVFDNIKEMSITHPTDSQGARWWLLTGALAMGALLYFRQVVFWLPHPIGMIMLVNPIMGTYWFSIFLGWFFKTGVSKYGNKETYDKARMLFVGLIVGELLMCLFGADLNRN